MRTCNNCQCSVRIPSDKVCNVNIGTIIPLYIKSIIPYTSNLNISNLLCTLKQLLLKNLCVLSNVLSVISESCQKTNTPLAKICYYVASSWAGSQDRFINLYIYTCTLNESSIGSTQTWYSLLPKSWLLSKHSLWFGCCFFIRQEPHGSYTWSEALQNMS
jgi:hypothetical protein